MHPIKAPCIAVLTLASFQAFAFNMSYEDWGLDISFLNKLSAGAVIRMQDRSDDLIGKTNVPGQMNLCASDNCLDFPATNNAAGAAHNQKLVNAPGAFSGVNQDDGDLNYDKYDITSFTLKYIPDLTIWLEARDP